MYAPCYLRVLCDLRGEKRSFSIILGNSQLETRYLGPDFGPVRTMKQIIPNHMTALALEHAKALVLVHITWRQYGLLAHHTLALHFGVATNVIMDEPVPPEKLGGTIAYIFDANVVNEDIAWLARVRMLGRKARPHCNADAVCAAVKEGLHAYLMRVTDMTP